MKFKRTRFFMMRVAWHVREFGDWLYFKGLGKNDYSYPQYCKHCEKWNFEE